MSVFIPLWIAEAVFAALFILAGYPIATKKGFVVKMFACALYMANALYAFSLAGRTTYGVMILLGLTGGLIGDVFLAIEPYTRDKLDRKQSMILNAIGGLFFLLGHAAYMAAFLHLLRAAHAFRFLPFALAVGGMLVCLALVACVCKVSAGKFIAPILLYAVGISCMFALAVCTAVQVYAGRPVMQAVLIATPVLFIFSDITLALRVADSERFESLPMRTVSLAAYFLAQMLFGLSICIA